MDFRQLRRRWVWATCLLLPAFVGTSSLNAQQVQGMLFDEVSAAPIEGAIVSLKTMDGDDIVQVLTDLTGRFKLDAPGPGRFLVSVFADGYLSLEPEAVDLAEDAAPSLLLSLRAEADVGEEAAGDAPLYRLEGFTVEGEAVPRRLQPFYERMQSSTGGNFLTREDMEQAGTMPLAEALDRVPGTKVRRTYGPYFSLTVRGCEPAIYVDGHPEFVPGRLSAAPSDALTVQAGSIAAVEVYPSPATIPAEFARFNALCVVAIWSQR